MYGRPSEFGSGLGFACDVIPELNNPRIGIAWCLAQPLPACTQPTPPQQPTPHQQHAPTPTTSDRYRRACTVCGWNLATGRMTQLAQCLAAPPVMWPARSSSRSSCTGQCRGTLPGGEPSGRCVRRWVWTSVLPRPGQASSKCEVWINRPTDTT